MTTWVSYDRLKPLPISLSHKEVGTDTIACHVMSSSKLAIAFEVLNRLENVDARHNFTCCQSCGTAELESLEDAENETIGYCFYHGQDANGIGERRELYLSYGGYRTPQYDWSSDEIASIIRERLVDFGLRTEWEWDEGGSEYVRVLLDDDSIDFVAAWSEGFAEGERVAYDWEYFDFAKEWDRFAEHWYDDEVQTILQDSINVLNLEKDLWSYLFPSDLQIDPWEKGNALWQLSHTYYTYRVFLDEILDGPANPHRLYNRTMSRIQPAFCIKEEERFLASDTGKRLIYDIASRTEGVRSLIYTKMEPYGLIDNEWSRKTLPDIMVDPYECNYFSFEGRAVLHEALKTVARRMFPGQDVFEVCGPDNVEILVLPGQTIVFDLYGHYFSDHERWPGFSTESVVSMFRLNQMKSRL